MSLLSKLNILFRLDKLEYNVEGLADRVDSRVDTHAGVLTLMTKQIAEIQTRLSDLEQSNTAVAETLYRHEDEIDASEARLTEHTNATLSELDAFETAMNDMYARVLNISEQIIKLQPAKKKKKQAVKKTSKKTK